MKYVDEFRDRRLIDKVAKRIGDAVDRGRAYNIMEVCGTHTMNIFRFALKEMLPSNINLISGPGCPVCVTPTAYLDRTIALANLKNVMITTFGDMLRVPGSRSSLERERARGNSIKIVYSADDAVAAARKNSDKEVVFLGIGFETTAPTVAVSILSAKKTGIKNYSVLCGHKTMPEVLKTLVKGDVVGLDGFLLPGHVSTIIGLGPYRFLSRRYGKRCVIAGFEPLDILQGILMLISQKTPKVEVQYTRMMNSRGNPIAQKVIDEVFEKTSSEWRGVGAVKKSGLKIRSGLSDFDAEKRFDIKIKPSKNNRDCICGAILKGVKMPLDCGLFGKLCSPENPVGACMVSSEGTCAAYYKYGEQRVKGVGYRV